MNEEEFKKRYKYRSWEWPKIGDKVRFENAEGIFYPHYINIIQFAKDNLKVGETYTVRNCEAYSSWCAVWLDEIEGDHFFHFSMFQWPVKEKKMNRELTFRIWDKQNKKWIENSSSLHCFSNWTICPFTGNLVDYVGAFGCDNFTASPAHGYYFEGAEVVREPRYVIQQYTGLKDSKGVEIYEGDIVKYNPDDRTIEREGIIEWSNYYHGWTIRDKQCYPESNYGVFSLASPFMSFNDVEIICHIFENSELIKNNE